MNLIFTLGLLTSISFASYQFTTVINKASSQTDTYLFEDYSLGKNHLLLEKKV